MYLKMRNLLFCALANITIVSLAQESWEVDKNKDGIVVHTRLGKESEFKSFKAVVTVAAPIQKVIQVLRAAEDYTRWYGYTETARVLKTENNIQFNYVETIFPWPYPNRDMVYKMTIKSSNPKSVMITLEGIPDYLPERKGIIRMQKAAGYLLLEADYSNTKITYLFHSEPGGNIPVWLANHSIAELPYRTLQGLRNMLENGVSVNK